MLITFWFSFYVTFYDFYYLIFFMKSKQIDMNESLLYYNVVPLRYKNRATWTKSFKWLLQIIVTIKNSPAQKETPNPGRTKKKWRLHILQTPFPYSHIQLPIDHIEKLFYVTDSLIKHIPVILCWFYADIKSLFLNLIPVLNQFILPANDSKQVFKRFLPII